MGTLVKLLVAIAVIYGAYAVYHNKHKAIAHTFEVHGDEAYDPITDLTWKRCSVGQKMNGGACEGGIPGYKWDVAQRSGDDKWRVPTEKELVTLIDPDRADKGLNPAVDTTVFPGILKDGATYWTSSRSSGASCWYVRFSQGSAGINQSAGAYRQLEFNEYGVQLVHSGR
jgi:hypothetical protein